MTELSALNVRITGDASGLKTAVSSATTELQKVGAAAAATTAKTSALGGAAGKLGAAFKGNAFGNVARQLSQVGQMATATGQPLQALAIQAADIGMVFGGVGAIIGTVAGIALPMLVTAFASADGGAKALADTMDHMDDAVSNFSAAVDAATAPTEKLIERYGRLAGAAREALAAMGDVARIEAINSVNAAVKAVADSLLAWDVVGQQLGKAVYGQVLADDFGLAANEAQRLKSALVDLQNAKGLEAQAAAAREVMAALKSAYGSVDAMPGPLREAYSQMAQIAANAAEANATVAKMPGLLSAVSSAARAAAGGFGAIQSAADAAYGSVAKLAGKMWEAAQGRVDGKMEYLYRGMKGRGQPAPKPGAPSAGGGGGGGGGAGRDYASELAAFQESLASETELEMAQYQQRQTMLQEFLAAKVLTMQEYQAYMEQIKADHEEKLRQIEMAAYQQRLSETASAFGALASIAQSGGQRMAKAAAAFQAIEGTINAYGAAIKALNTPGLSLAGRFAAYASVLAAGLKGVAAIRSAGGIGGGSGSAASAATASASSSPLQVNLTTYGFGDFIRTGDLQQLLTQLNKTAGDRGYTMLVPA